MQTVSSTLTAKTLADIRQVSWKLLMSFLKDYDASVTFFTIGDSLIGGTDIIKGTGSVIQEWDKYTFQDYTNRVISFEYAIEQDPYLGGGILSMVDLVLDNSDGWFTPENIHSDIRNHILPFRPMKLQLGFGGEVCPIFTGITDGMPEIDAKNKTVKFHCIDFMQAIFNYPLDEAVIYQDYRVSEIMSALIQMTGLTTAQIDLDEGFVIVPFFFADKGQKLGDVLRKLASAEMGKIFMTAEGTITFRSRDDWVNNTEVVHTFDESNTIERKTTKEDNIINVVEVKAKTREVQAKNKIWESVTTLAVPAGGTADMWADFDDPVTSVDDPVYITGATTSYYSTNINSDGSGAPSNSYIALDSTDVFAKSMKLTFSNSHPTSTIYITKVELHGTPAPVVSEVYARVQDDDSVSKYDERPKTIENDYIQDDATANSIAQIIVSDNKNYNEAREITVKGVPQLQIGDLVRVTNRVDSDVYYVQKIVGKLQVSAFVQTLTVLNRTINPCFRIGISTIGGPDQIAP